MLFEDIWTSISSTILPYSIGGITVEAHVNPIMEVNIMPWHLAYTLLGDVTLRPSDKLLKCCPFGHIIEYRGVASDAANLRQNRGSPRLSYL